MRKTITLLPILLLAGLIGAHASTVLTHEQNTCQAGDQLIKQQVTYKDPGSCGRSLHWDFRLLQPLDEDYTLNYFIPDSTRMNVLCGQEHRTRYYYTQLGDSLWASGQENSTSILEYTTPELRMRYPFSYGDTLFSHFEGLGEYGRRVDFYVKGYTRVHADAEGELLLPGNETVRKALRVRTTRYYTEAGRDSLRMTLDTYAWYAAGIRYPVFESIRTSVQYGEQNDTTIFTTSFYYPPEQQCSQLDMELPAALAEEELTGASAVFTQARLLPNPVTDYLQISYTLTRYATIWFTVHSGGGIPLCQTTPQHLEAGSHTTPVAMSHLIPGTYTLYVHVDDMVMLMNVVKK